MASLEYISLPSLRYELSEDNTSLVTVPDKLHEPIEDLPQIFWKTGEPWVEACLWSDAREIDSNISHKTNVSSMKRLVYYANWLEDKELSWTHFPEAKKDRCLALFRGHLIRQRDAGVIAPGTASTTMAAAISFYRWVHHEKLIDRSSKMWADKVYNLPFKDKFGFERTVKIMSTDLSISKGVTRGKPNLEGGLLPVTKAQRNRILSFVQEHSNDEFELMLRLGFGTGMRLGSICDLKVGTIDQATPSGIPGFSHVFIGPKARPTVATKKSRASVAPSGQILIPNNLLSEIEIYIHSKARHSRLSQANLEHCNLVFLTKSGRPYMDGRGECSAVSTEMARLRKLADRLGEDAFDDFHFHRSRATFATHLMIAALEVFTIPEAIKFVRDACLHKDEAVTMRYIKFLEQNKSMSEAGTAFHEFFMGVARG